MDADAELVARAKRGSSKAAEALIDRHWERAWYAAYALTGNRADADEVTQDAFERAFRSVRKFDGRSAFATWLHRIVVNRALDVVRRERRDAPVAQATQCYLLDEPARDDELVEAIAGLGRDRRTVVVLRYWLDLSPHEIAEVLDLPVGTVHSRLARALAELRSHLEVEDARSAR